MGDDLSKRGGQDRQRINVNQEYELRGWAEKLGVSKERIKEAVQAVGDRADKVEQHLSGGGDRKAAKRASDAELGQMHAARANQEPSRGGHDYLVSRDRCRAGLNRRRSMHRRWRNLRSEPAGHPVTPSSGGCFDDRRAEASRRATIS